jgi:hypothetical protein
MDETVGTLCGKQDGFNASALTPQAFQSGTPNWRTELYDTCGQGRIYHMIYHNNTG